MRIIPFCILFFFQGLMGQTSYYTRNIEWEHEIPGNNSSLDYDITKFSGSYYRDYTNLFPLYHENIRLNAGVNVEELSLFRFDTESISLHFLSAEFKKGLTEHFRLEVYPSTESGKKILQYSLFPFRHNPETNQIERLTNFVLELKYTANSLPGSKSGAKKTLKLSNSPLASGEWYKIRTETEGIHKISYEDLIQLGITNPANVRIYGWGGRQLPEDSREGKQDDFVSLPVYMEKGTDGAFNENDFILFYAPGTASWSYDSNKNYFFHSKNPYSDYGYFFLTSDSSPAGSPPTLELAQEDPDYTTSEYDYLTFYELDEVNLIKSGKEWYGEIFDVTTEREFSFEIPDLKNSTPVQLNTSLLGRAKSQSSFIIYANNKPIDTAYFRATDLDNYVARYAYTSSEIYSFNSTNDNVNIKLEYQKPDGTAQGWLDYLSLNARAALTLQGSELGFRDHKSADSLVTEYVLNGINSKTQVWEISDYPAIKKVASTVSGNTMRFRTYATEMKEFIAFNPDAEFPGVDFEDEGLGLLENQDLKGSGFPDLVIISYEGFLDYAQQLADFRKEHNELDVLITTPQKIYNEFSSGRPDVTAIRNYMQYLYQTAGGDEKLKPQYLLLFGDGSYIFKSDNPNDGNFVPAYQSDQSLVPDASFVTDDFYGLLDEGENLRGGLLDIGIGRLPISSEEEAEILVEKIINYESPERQGEWRNAITFIGDDEDGNIHFRQADELARYVEDNYPEFNINKIYLDAYPQISTPVGQRYPGVNKAINDQVNKGALIVNYTGHGGTRGLADEKILEINDIQSWENEGKLPLFMTATCEFSRFDDPEEVSAGERVILSPGGGGIALLTTTRLVYAGPNHVLNEKFYEIVFEKNEQGDNYCLGDIMKYSKNEAGPGLNKRNFTLLGDPAMRLTYPFYDIVADSINSQNIENATDTLKAFSEVTISGQVRDLSGNRLDTFNGIVYPIVYDKPNQQSTLANDPGSSKKNFELRNNILYKGKATVENGNFRFSFIVPKDINYAFGNGKISFYASDSIRDASGAYMEMIVGGSEDNIETDTQGPEVEVYMNNNFFTTGGITDDSPVLFVEVYDEKGVNTAGNGIGHDITAILNGDTKNTLVLNDYYQADLNSFQSGTIKYPLNDLPEGRHLVEVKVWDIYNNSTTASTQFVVVNSEEMLLDNLMNYPNPFRENTYFSFEHNKADQDLDITIDIFDMSGALVRTIKAKEYASGFRSQPVYWNGAGESGNQSRQGTYLYRIRVISSDGSEASETGRLIILR
jgi:hypothetical protein